MIRLSSSVVRANFLLRHTPATQNVRHFSKDDSFQGTWKFLSESTPVHYMQEALTAVHDISGLPWWATIAVSTFALRTVITLPLTVYEYKIISRIEKIRKEYPAIIEELKRETAIAKNQFKWTDDQAKRMFMHSAAKQWNNLVVRENCHPAKTKITILFQLPFWITTSVAIRNLVYCLPNPNLLEAKMAFMDLCTGGFLWIPNLTVPDESWILPVALGLVNFTNMKIQMTWRKTGPETKLQTGIRRVFIGLNFVMVYIATIAPSALCLYWVSSSMHGMVQNLAFVSPKVRRVLGIPELKHYPKDKPYKYLLERMLSRNK
ncbi:cytochrome c oxidase assembly protein COX18, mitochondrial [Culicoides brevitarsis]|uniref:cytochrome c oxidase assembly protein COX18, mitochondrial n=1 Tax=Culicoides brevitarsis TaxID=469753 RepID=UPI00307B1F09